MTPCARSVIIELIVDHDCPNARLARERLVAVAGRHPELPPFREWERSDPSAPPHIHRYGSPTVLIDGRDVAGLPPADAPCCRLYRDANGQMDGAPSVEAIERALAVRTVPGHQRLGLVGAVVAIGTAVLPVAGCPACWPAWLAILASAGLGFLAATAWQIALLSIALVGMGIMVWRSAHRWRIWMLAGLLVGGSLNGVGKALTMPVLGWIGAGLLILVSCWSLWPRNQRSSCGCP